MKHLVPIIIFLLATSLRIAAQEEHITQEEHYFQHHRVALFTGYGLIQGAVNADGDKQTQGGTRIIGLDYEYLFNHKYGIGLLNDLELASI